MVRIVLSSLITCFLLAGCEKNIKIVTPDEIGNLVYKNTFESKTQALDSGSLMIKKDIHKNSLIFKTRDSTFTRFKKEITPDSSFSISFWFKPDFYGRNGTIITLSKDKKDFPIHSVLSLFMNKNRIAVMQNGADLRKVDYKNRNEFTTYFISLKELKISETYFLTYIYENNTIKILIDGELYAQYIGISNLSSFTFITLGASWNKNGGKYYFNGSIDDLYMFNQALDDKDLFNIMTFTHVYQYAK